MTTGNGNGDLTREILRAELKAGLETQTNAYRREMDKRFEPVLAHIRTVELGEWTQAQKDSILRVVNVDREAHSIRRGRTVPVLALVVSLATLGALVLQIFTVGGIH